jgi:hypothetical protein
MSYYNNWDDQDDWNKGQNEQREMERQLKEEEYFDGCWDLHEGLRDYLYDNYIPILQDCQFEHFYKLCQHGGRYIVDLENKEKQAEQKRLNYLENLNKPFEPTSPKWVVLGGKKNKRNKTNKSKKKKKSPKKIEKIKNPMQKYNWTKNNKTK